jgi:hypothetical protein
VRPAPGRKGFQTTASATGADGIAPVPSPPGRAADAVEARVSVERQPGVLNELDWNNAADWAHPGKLGKYRW